MSSTATPSRDVTTPGPGAGEALRHEAGGRANLVLGGRTLSGVTQLVCGIVEGKTPWWWWPAFVFAASLAGVMFTLIGYLIVTGVGVWGLNQPVGWAWDITNFVFWVGIGHAGTLISAILFLLRQNWRTSINRAAEAMTVFAVMCAGIFPAIHVGRVWRAYFLAPIPNHLDLWPNFRSPLLWDVFAVSTYATVSIMFWYVGLIPDLATLRDRATTKIRQVAYGFFALGWCGGHRQWRHYEMAYLILAGLSTPLVLSVHSVVSFDFATSQIPGWHTTIFPPYFVAGAIFSGFAMVITLLVPARALFGLHDLITPRHLDNICKVLLATGCIVGYAYAMEFFIAWYSGNPFESFVFFVSRATGPYAWAYWTMVSCNVVAPQFFWSRRVRHSPGAMFAISIVVNVGMWFERFVIIVTSLHRDALPSSWGYFSPTWVDIWLFIGSFGFFFTNFLLFLRYLPAVAMAEVKSVMRPQQQREAPARVDAPATLPERAGETGGVIAEFDNADDLLHAAEAVRDAGYRKFDTHAPYPIHGMDEALGVGRSKLGWIVAAMATLGVLMGFALAYYTSVVSYPIITGGKPFNSWPAFIVVMFELGVLFASFGAVGGMLLLNGLPRWYHPTLKHKPFLDASNHRFFLVIEPGDPGYEPRRAAHLLADAGGRSVTVLEE